ncbi:MAG: hypothetical protein J7J98_05600 [candidate division Zixibacteria bacterium]|nr:hypothetical protein [candidate division Zixibacteria bacterium]
MKKVTVLMVVALMLSGGSVYSQNAVGSMFGTLTTAKAMGQGSGDFGFGIGLADDATSFIGSFAYGLSEYSDGRIKIGLSDSDWDGDTKIVFGVDYKWQFWSYGPETTHPFDFSVGAFLEYADYSAISVLQLGGQLLASYPIALNNGRSITPYGRFNARMESLSWDLPIQVSGDDSESNLEVGFNAGVKWEMTSSVDLYGEFQLDGNDGLFLGIDFNVM